MFGWLYQLFWWSNQILWLILKSVFAEGNNNFVIAVIIIIIIIIIILYIVIKNSNNNILFKKKEKEKFQDCPKDTLFQTEFEPATFEFPTYVRNYLTRPNDLGYNTICVFRCFLMHLLGGLAINYFRHYMFSYVIADAVANTSVIL